MSIRVTTSEETKKRLRKIKTLPLAVKAIVYGGNLRGPAMAVQFNSDVRVYNLWEAILYVEGYEESGDYKPGTASLAINAALVLDDAEE